MIKFTRFFAYAMIATAATFMVSCSDDDDSGNDKNNETPSEDMSFIVVSGDPETDLTGGVYMKIFSDLTTTKENQTIYGDDVNGVKSLDGFTQISYNTETGVFTGYVYARAASAQGLGSSQAGLRSYKVSNNSLYEFADPVYLSNFGNTGTFGTYSYAAQISNPVVERIDANGECKEFNFATLTVGDNETPSISNIIDMGNDQLAIVMTYTDYDSAVVVFTDYDMNIKSTIGSNSIGSSVGAQRSVRYSLSGADDDGNVYVFCGSSSDDSKIGALRIKSGTTEFDSTYKFDILEASEGYRFRKAFHICDDYFLVEFFIDKDSYGNTATSGNLAVLKMSTQTLTWVKGLPDASSISISWGDGYDGYYYLPVSAATSFTSGSTEAAITPTIYKINQETGEASAFMTFADTDLLKGIRILK